VTEGLAKGGIVVVNSKKPAADLKASLGDHWRLAAIDATRIARETIGVPIVNTTMLGALIKATGVVETESLVEPLRERFGRLADRNINAMKRAVEETAMEELR
jgi:pyruvate ferredoxin oxidoreductase gamma subunit